MLVGAKTLSKYVLGGKSRVSICIVDFVVEIDSNKLLGQVVWTWGWHRRHP